VSVKVDRLCEIDHIRNTSSVQEPSRR